VIARALVRDTLTSELKLLIAKSRFSNASSLFGTMALDVFPIEGRPRSKELVVPPYELTNLGPTITETAPVKITTTSFPTPPTGIFVGKSVQQSTGGNFFFAAANGITSYIWSSVGLPDGLTINASGQLLGTSLELGIFNVTVAVQDSSVPFSIDEITLPLTVETDLKVQMRRVKRTPTTHPLRSRDRPSAWHRLGSPTKYRCRSATSTRTHRKRAVLPRTRGALRQARSRLV